MTVIPRLTIFLSLLVMLSSCEFHCSVGNTAERKDKKNAVMQDGAALYNNIRVKTNQVTLKQAYLADKLTGEEIGEGNFVNMKNGVKLVLLIDKGWTEVNGRVFIGASLKATADNGSTILDEPDLFKTYEAEGIKLSDSKLLGLSMYFTEWSVTRPVTIDVLFKVWDKKGEGTIEGSYRVHTK